MDRGTERRIERLEKLVGQQGYVCHVLMWIVIFDTAGLLWLWGEQGRPNFDHIAVSLTVFQTLFGIAALYGFWALRGLTRETAQDVAEEEVKKVAPSIILRYLADNPIAFEDRQPLSDTDVGDIVDAMRGEEAELGE